MKEYSNVELELRAALKDIKEGESKVLTEKKRLINDIKNGLGSEIKSNPNKVVIIKKPWYSKIGLMLKKIFTKF
jgi:hypothetical protein